MGAWQQDSKQCPFCAETILAAAVVCKHCGRDFNGERPVLTVAVREPRQQGIGDFVLKLVFHVVAWTVIMVLVTSATHSSGLAWCAWLVFFGVTRYFKYRK